MRILPAVDIRGGRCVNLVQGDYAQETVFAEDPVEQARQWWLGLGESGIVHIVDLDGAKAGRCCVQPQLESLADLGIAFQVGGGIRNRDTVDTLLSAGASRVIIGTAAYRDPAFFADACAAYPGRIVAGIDARSGMVAVEGWTDTTEMAAADLATRVRDAGAARIVYTDILRDGMLQGPNFDTTAELAEASGLPVTLSGGVSSIDDVRMAAALVPRGVDEMIVGRALYVRAFSIEDALAAASGR